MTGLATATSEGDPIVALGGATTVANRLRRVHQAMDTVSIMKPITKYSAEVSSSDAISEVVADAFRAAESGRPGASFVSLPMDIMAATASGEVLTPVMPDQLGADDLFIDLAAVAINRTKNHVVPLGMLASQMETANAVRGFLKEQRVPQGHSLRAVRKLTDVVLRSLRAEFDALYAVSGRPSIAPEYILRALLLRMFYSVRSERLLVEQIDYNLLFRWFVGLGMDDAVWNHAVFSKNRDRLLTSDVAQRFFAEVNRQAKRFMSDEHFTVDGTLIQAWASQKSFRFKGGSDESLQPDA